MPRSLLLALLFLAGCSGAGSTSPVGAPPSSPLTPAPREDARDMPVQDATPNANRTGLVPHVITHDGIQRDGLLSIPDDARGPMPVVVLLHGFGGDANAFAADRAGLLREADARGWMVSIPTGTLCLNQEGNCWASRDDAGSIAVSDADDVGYLRAVIRDLGETQNVDTERVYVVGFSNGGSMAQRLAAEAPELLAAGASVAGTVGRTLGIGAERNTWFTTPEPLAPVPMLLVKGLTDRVFPYFGGREGMTYEVLNAMYEHNYWATFNGCDITKQAYTNLSRTFPDQIPGGVGWVDSHEGCTDGAIVRMVAVKDLGHAWPMARDRYDADVEVLDWFEALAR